MYKKFSSIFSQHKIASSALIRTQNDSDTCTNTWLKYLLWPLCTACPNKTAYR